MDLKKYIPWIGAGWGVTLLMNVIMFAVIGVYDLALWVLLGMQTSPTLFWVVVGIYVVLVLLFTAVEYRMGKPFREQYKTTAADNPMVKYAPWKDWSFGKIYVRFLGLFACMFLLEITTLPFPGDKLSVSLILKMLLATLISSLICTVAAYLYGRRKAV